MAKQINARECCWWDSCKTYTGKHNSWCKECNRNNVINRHDKRIDNYKRKLSCEINQKRDIVITINHSTPKEYPIKFVQQIESAIDNALAELGFTRSTTTKDNKKVELVYYQFGVCVGITKATQ